MANPPDAIAHLLQAVLDAEATTLRKVVAAVLDGHATQVDMAQILDADDAALAEVVSTVLKQYDDASGSPHTRGITQPQDPR